MSLLSVRQTLTDLRFAFPRGFDVGVGLSHLARRPRPLGLRDLLEDFKNAAFFLSEGPLRAGNVDGSAKFMAKPDGDWALSGHLHTSSSLVGDKYGLVFHFKDPVLPDNPGFATDGTLGAALDSEPRSLDFRVGNERGKPNPWIRNNWPTVFNGRGEFTLSVSDSQSPLELILGGLVLIAAVSSLLLAHPQPTLDPDNPPRPPGEDDTHP